jgi:hypothetical protein
MSREQGSPKGGWPSTYTKICAESLLQSASLKPRFCITSTACNSKGTTTCDAGGYQYLHKATVASCSLMYRAMHDKADRQAAATAGAAGQQAVVAREQQQRKASQRVVHLAPQLMDA